MKCSVTYFVLPVLLFTALFTAGCVKTHEVVEVEDTRRKNHYFFYNRLDIPVVFERYFHEENKIEVDRIRIAAGETFKETYYFFQDDPELWHVTYTSDSVRITFGCDRDVWYHASDTEPDDFNVFKMWNYDRTVIEKGMLEHYEFEIVPRMYDNSRKL